MGSFDKLFGLVLLVAGITIAAYWTLWVVFSIVSLLLATFSSISLC